MKKSLILILIILIIPVSAIEITHVINKEKITTRDTSTTRHVYAMGHLADISSDTITYMYQDRIQSNRIATNSNGDIEKEFKSLPFGQELINEGVRYSFATGKELDSSSGLYYFGARYYDADLGRFTSVDPIRENHPYSYVLNNPINGVDPTGADPTETKLRTAITDYSNEKWNGLFSWSQNKCKWENRKMNKNRKIEK